MDDKDSHTLLAQKAEKYVQNEVEFWKHRYTLEYQNKRNADVFEFKFSETMPEELSTVVWGLTDGVVFIRYYSPGKKGEVEFRTLDISINQWGQEGLIVRLPEGDISLTQKDLMHGVGNITIRDAHFISGVDLKEYFISYVEFNYVYYGSSYFPSPVERAMLHFQGCFLNLHKKQNQEKKVNQPIVTDSIFPYLEKVSSEFATLLEASKKEEELQVFLKKHPIVLHPTAELIPKKKLGEDFITDFVLVSPSDQGATYTLVEIEKASHPILVKDNSLSRQTNHAIKQTRDWDVWLEKNKAYLQTKLPNFESPQYLVIIGRGNILDDNAKAYLRSYNRDWKNIELLTYDDVLVRFKAIIKSLKVAGQISM